MRGRGGKDRYAMNEGTGMAPVLRRARIDNSTIDILRAGALQLRVQPSRSKSTSPPSCQEGPKPADWVCAVLYGIVGLRRDHPDWGAGLVRRRQESRRWRWANDGERIRLGSGEPPRRCSKRCWPQGSPEWAQSSLSASLIAQSPERGGADVQTANTIFLTRAGSISILVDTVSANY